MINAAWFVVLAGMLTAYAVLDGFDLGVGALHLFVGRTPDERQSAISAIGPVWNGNEVWLIGSGGAMVAAFPHLYATAFSGFYLALMIVLWLLILRGVAIEFRHQVDHDLWRDAWDALFAVSSALLALLFGVALGNVLRGVPLDATGSFQGSFALLQNPFALLCGALSVIALSLHGAAYLAMKTDGDLQARARRFIAPLWAGMALLLVAVTAASFRVQPTFTGNFVRWPILSILPAGAVGAAASINHFRRRCEDTRTFLSSGALIVFVLASVAAGMFPRLLPTLEGDPTAALDIYNSAAATGTMATALTVFGFGMLIVVAYQTLAYRSWRGKVDHTVYH
jgi:cytochrome bd ubiquinol oxidase subunit II